MLKTLSKRLERLENRILPNLAEQQTLIVDFVSVGGEVVKSLSVVLDQSRLVMDRGRIDRSLIKNLRKRGLA